VGEYRGQSNVDKMNTARSEASRHLGTKKYADLRNKIGEIETYNQGKKIRDLYSCNNNVKKSYQHRIQ
jgi:hypothetical protein